MVRLRGAGLVFVGNLASNLALLIASALAGHVLGPADFGSIAAMLALTIVLSVPAFGLTTMAARRVAVDGSVSSVAPILRQAATIGLALFVLGALAAPFLASLLGTSIPLVLITVLAAVPLMFLAVPRGVLQGNRHYGAFSLNFAVEGFARLAIVAIALWSGAGVIGVGSAPAAAAAAALVVGWMQTRRAYPLRRLVRRSSAKRLTGVLATSALYAGLAGLASVDVLVAKARFASQSAGEYAGAALFGKIVFFLPAALGAVLLPEVARNVAARKDTMPILFRTLAVLMVLCGAITLIALVAATPVRTVLVGSDYPATDALLAPFGLSMTALAIGSLLATYLVAIGKERVGWLFIVAVPLQVLVLSFVPASGLWLITATGVISAALVVVCGTWIKVTARA